MLPARHEARGRGVEYSTRLSPVRGLVILVYPAGSGGSSGDRGSLCLSHGRGFGCSSSSEETELEDSSGSAASPSESDWSSMAARRDDQTLSVDLGSGFRERAMTTGWGCRCSQRGAGTRRFASSKGA